LHGSLVYLLRISFCLFFFFSSRRRHTRLVSDWSSDVCSSDLGRRRLVRADAVRAREARSGRAPTRRRSPHPWRGRHHPGRSRAGPVAGRGLRRSLVVLVAFGGLMLATLIGPRLLRGLGFFRVRRIEIVGSQYLAPSKIMGVLGLEPNASVFDDPAPLMRRTLAIPGVKSAVIRRRMPGTLQIAVVEAVPVALAPNGGGNLSMLD